MTSLGVLQREFMDAIRGERDSVALSIYRLQSLGAWRDALAAAHPVVARLVGAVFFQEAADRYADRHPSMSGDLHAYGARFADFLAGYPHAASLAYLPDVARLEWALHESSFAADGQAIDLRALASVDEMRQDGLVLRWHPAVRLLASRHPVLALWEANQPARDGTPSRTEGGDRILVARNAGGTSAPVALDAAEWRCAEAISRQAALGALADALGKDAPRLPMILTRFAAMGAVGGFVLP